MARKVRNHPVPRDKMSENKLSEQTPKVKTHDFSVALYIRLSKEDSGKNNQNTVENQKALLEDFVKDKPQSPLNVKKVFPLPFWGGV